MSEFGDLDELRIALARQVRRESGLPELIESSYRCDPSPPSKTASSTR